MNDVTQQFDAGSANSTFARLFVWVVLLLLITYDIFAFIFRWRTITAVCRDIDYQTGTLFRWTLLAVWIHLFVAWGRLGYGN